MKLIIHDVHDDHPECHNKDTFLKKEMFNHPIHLLSFNETKAEKKRCQYLNITCCVVCIKCNVERAIERIQGMDIKILIA